MGREKADGSHRPSLAVPHVIHVVPSLDHGGLERLVVDWANARNQDHAGSTEIVCLDALGELASLVEGGHVSCLGADRSRFPWDRAAVTRLRNVAMGDTDGSLLPTSEPRSPDFAKATSGKPTSVLHSHNLAAQQYAALACFGACIRHVHTEHGSKQHLHGWKNRARNRLLSRLTDRLVAVSDAVAQSMVEKEGINERLITVIPNGIAPMVRPPDPVLAALRSELDIPSDAVVIGTVGRLAEVKGQDRQIAAFGGMEEMLTTKHAKYTKGEGAATDGRPWLLLVGDGPKREALEKQACNLDIGDRVIFVGYREDARDLISLLDLFVLPSRSEGLPVALLEAMAAGVPVMATDAGESWAVLEDGNCGVKLPVDEGRWGEVISYQLSVISEDETRERVGRAAKRVREKYSLDATLEAYEEIYRGVS